MTFLVTGITGHVGGAAARHLLAQGHAVRALCRDPAKAAAWTARGVELVRGDLGDPAALASALRGVAGAFVMLPPVLAPSPGHPESQAMIASIRAALDRALPPRLVVLSSIGSQQPHGLGLITSTHLLERALADLTVPTVIIRAGTFLENYAHGLAVGAATGVFPTFLTPDRPLPHIASEDIGREVAHRLTAPATGRVVIELGTRWSPADLAHAIGEVVGRPVVAQAIPREAWAATIQSFGLAPGTTGPYEEMFDGYNRGWIDFGVPGTIAVPATITPHAFYAALPR